MSSLCDRLPVLPQLRTRQPCIIDAPIKKRNGQPYYWCHAHGKEVHVPAGGGSPDACSGAGATPVPDEQIFELNLDECHGGAAAWGACPPVIAHGAIDEEHGGVHVHARHAGHSDKFLDDSFTIVRVTSGGRSIDIDEESARAFLVSSIAGRENVVLQCPRCGWPHLDRDTFAVGPHRKHVCNRCGRSFWAQDLTISNPAVMVRQLPGVGVPSAPQPAGGSIELHRDTPGGFAIWGSNPAIFWTFERAEAEGIHVHVWDETAALITDETFGEVTIDGHLLDPQLVRVLMAQRLMFNGTGRLASLICPSCGALCVDRGVDAFQPSNAKHCSSCGTEFTTPRRRHMVSNPLIALLRDLDLN